MDRAHTTDWGTIGRTVASIGLAVGAWLWCIPASAGDGTSCGVPLVHATDEAASGFAPDCADRNGVRVTQGFWTIAVAGGWLTMLGLRAWLLEAEARGASGGAGAGRLDRAAWALRTEAQSAPTTRAEWSEVPPDHP